MYCVLTVSFIYIYLWIPVVFSNLQGCIPFPKFTGWECSALAVLMMRFLSEWKWWWDFWRILTHFPALLNFKLCFSVWCRDQTFCTYNNKKIRINGSPTGCSYFLAEKVPLVTLFLVSTYHIAYIDFSMGVWEQTIDKFYLFLPLLMWEVLCICIAFIG